jgi:HTH-type transcriptional regulator/antitoxin HigA
MGIPFVADEVLPPGETLLETLEALSLNQAQLATRSGLSAKHINQLVKGAATLSHETALALEKVTGVKARFWNALESNYREHLARLAEEAKLSEEQGWLNAMPVSQLRSEGFVSETRRNPGKLVKELLEFFGVGSIEAWRVSWAEPAASFLQSAAFEAEQGAVAAWLRLGEKAAQDLACSPFDKDALVSRLPQIRALSSKSSTEFWPRVQEICAEVGVALVLVPEITGARASGATRWISPTKAVVQLSNRGKRDDKFWFAFFHELGHVLLHGKREVFLEKNIGDAATRPKQEEEANAFARRLLIPAEHESRLPSLLAEGDVRAFALELGIAPGIVAGRLQRDRNDYRLFTKLFRKFEIVRGH